MRSSKVTLQARRRIYEQSLPLSVRRTAWLLYQHELQRVNPATQKLYTPTRALTNIMKWMESQRMVNKYKNLTPKQNKIIQLVVEGLTQKQMALELKCDEATIKRHLAKIRRKLNAVSTYQVVAVAVEHGWVMAPDI